MIRYILVGVFLALGAAEAQTPQQVVPGSQSVTGCPGATVPCWTPYSTTNPQHVTIDGPDGPEGGVSVSINPYRMDPTNESGTITVGGAWQQVAPANSQRQRFFLQNYCSAATQGIAASESIFLASRPTMPTTSPLTAPSGTELVTCGAYDTSSAIVSISPMWVWGASTGHRFQALEW